MTRHKKSQIENEPTKIQITLGEIPNEFGRRVSHLVSTYSTYLVGLRQPDFYRHFGSGTFVQSSGRHYVLTAGHCAHRLKEDHCEEIGLSSIEGRSSRFRIPLLPPVIVDPPKRFGELGPDLAFLPIPPSKVGTIAAYNSFINLDVRRETMPQRMPKSGRVLWAGRRT